MRTKFSTVFTSLMLCAALSFLLACCSTRQRTPEPPEEAIAKCAQAIDDAVTQMMDQVRKNYGGTLPRDLQVAFYTPEPEISPYYKEGREVLKGGARVTREAKIVTPFYISKLERNVQRRVLEEAEGSFLVFDAEVFEMMLEELELTNPVQVVKPANMSRLRDQSEALATKPLDAICLIKVTGDQVRVSEYDFSWDIEVKLVDATAAATLPMMGSADFIAQEAYIPPLTIIHEEALGPGPIEKAADQFGR